MRGNDVLCSLGLDRRRKRDRIQSGKREVFVCYLLDSRMALGGVSVLEDMAVSTCTYISGSQIAKAPRDNPPLCAGSCFDDADSPVGDSVLL